MKNINIRQKEFNTIKEINRLNNHMPRELSKKYGIKYFDELDDRETYELKNGNLVYVDPGKIRILTMIDDYDNTFKYNSAQRQFELKTQKYNKKLQENDSYEFRKKMERYSFFDRQKSDAKLIQIIKEKYGNNPTLIIGDWSETVLNEDSQAIEMIKLLSKYFKMYLIDEFNTSKLNYMTEQPCENLEIKTMENGQIVTKKLHAVLRYMMPNGRMGCINRDINAVKNMRKIVHSVLSGNGWPERYKRWK